MKTIELKVIPAPRVDGTNGQIDYKAQLALILRAPIDVRGGMDIEEVRKSNRVLDALEKADKVLKLEDADYEFLGTKVRSARFAIASKAIEQFVDDVAVTPGTHPKQ